MIPSLFRDSNAREHGHSPDTLWNGNGGGWAVDGSKYPASDLCTLRQRQRMPRPRVRRSLNISWPSTSTSIPTMSSSPSPAPDAVSPSDSTGHSPRREESEPAQVSSEHEREPSEAPHDSESKSPDDASAEASSSSTSTNADLAPASASASTSDPSSASPSVPGTAPQGDWQAVWSPAHNAYYFYNSVTHETTWVNPLQPNAEAGPSNVSVDTPEASSSTADAPHQSTHGYDFYAPAAAHGIDPALAHLDPSLAGSSTNLAGFTYSAKFNARTGTFTRPDGRDPTHLSEYERAKRMSEFYFDVNAWESDVAQRKLEEAQEEEEGRKRKRPTKKDLVSAFVVARLMTGLAGSTVLIAGTCATGSLQGTETAKEVGEDGMAAYIDHHRFPLHSYPALVPFI